MSNEPKQYQQGDDEFDDARAIAAEDDDSGYEDVVFTSKKSQKTVTYQVRPPTMQQQEENRRAATRRGLQITKGSDKVTLPEVDGAELNARNLISAVYVKKGGQWVPCWTLADKAMLITRRGGGDSLITRLTEAYARVTKLKSVEEEKGNSDASPS